MDIVKYAEEHPELSREDLAAAFLAGSSKGAILSPEKSSGGVHVGSVRALNHLCRTKQAEFVKEPGKRIKMAKIL